MLQVSRSLPSTTSLAVSCRREHSRDCVSLAVFLTRGIPLCTYSATSLQAGCDGRKEHRWKLGFIQFRLDHTRRTRGYDYATCFRASPLTGHATFPFGFPRKARAVVLESLCSQLSAHIGLFSMHRSGALYFFISSTQRVFQNGYSK